MFSWHFAMCWVEAVMSGQASCTNIPLLTRLTFIVLPVTYIATQADEMLLSINKQWRPKVQDADIPLLTEAFIMLPQQISYCPFTIPLSVGGW